MEIGLFWTSVLIISVLANVVLALSLSKATKVIDILETYYENFFTEMHTQITTTIKTMKDIDIRGSFESDDEVGGVFKQMYEMVNLLDIFLTEPVVINEKTN